jgi:SAM-dependent methyltransferase
MAAWDEGYVTDVAYTRNFFSETTPAWLSASALFMGHRPPDLSRAFTYADLGCGHGLTAIVVAATCPQAEVWGFDFNPAHIESARMLADRAGIANVRFQEVSFKELATSPAPSLPSFDFMVSHGVLSWISPENQNYLLRTIGQCLRPGGLAYVSYNVATGWGGMPPVHTLMRLLARSAGPGTDQAAAGVLDYLDRLQKADAGFFSANPGIEGRLQEIRRQDPRYIAHEFLNEDWHPLMFADVHAGMAEVKCSYIGSATLTENIDVVSIAQTMQDLVRHTADPVLKETVRDFASAKGFRRDIYRRGVLPVPGVEHAGLIDALELEWLGRPVEDPIKLPTPLGIVGGLSAIYGPLVEMLRAGPCTIGTIRGHSAWAAGSVPDLLQAITLMMSGGYIHPALPQSVAATARSGIAGNWVRGAVGVG